MKQSARAFVALCRLMELLLAAISAAVFVVVMPPPTPASFVWVTVTVIVGVDGLKLFRA